MKIKVAELIRKIKATSKKAEEALSALSENIINVTLSEKESESVNLDGVIDKKFKKVISERTTTTDQALLDYADVSSNVRNLRLALDRANANIHVDYNGETYSLKDIILLYADKRRLSTALRGMPVRRDINPWEKCSMISVPQMAEREKKTLLDKLVAEIRGLDVLIQQTNWNEEVEV